MEVLTVQMWSYVACNTSLIGTTDITGIGYAEDTLILSFKRIIDFLSLKTFFLSQNNNMSHYLKKRRNLD